MARILAVTGGIGSGKSYAVNVFSAMGVPVYDADSRTKALYDTNSDLLNKLVSLMGNNLVKDGRLDRSWMASKVFNDRKLLDRVEETVYPYVISDIRDWAQVNGAGTNGLVIIESAVFLEKPAFAGLADKVATVSCPLEMRVERVMKRSGLSRKEVLDRMANQWDDAKREAMADFVIVSDGCHPLLPQVYGIYMKMNG